MRTLAWALLIGIGAIALASCSSSDSAAARPGTQGAPCAAGDLCDYGLACVNGTCSPGSWGLPPISSGGSTATDGSVDGQSGGAGGAAASGATGGTTGGTAGTTGGTAGTTGGTAGTTGGTAGTTGGTAGTTGGTGGTTGGTGGTTGGTGGTTGGTGGSDGGINCVGLPSLNGSCNRFFCYCSASNSCFPTTTAGACCSVQVTCF